MTDYLTRTVFLKISWNVHLLRIVESLKRFLFYWNGKNCQHLRKVFQESRSRRFIRNVSKYKLILLAGFSGDTQGWHSIFSVSPIRRYFRNWPGLFRSFFDDSECDNKFNSPSTIRPRIWQKQSLLIGGLCCFLQLPLFSERWKKGMRFTNEHNITILHADIM